MHARGAILAQGLAGLSQMALRGVEGLPSVLCARPPCPRRGPSAPRFGDAPFPLYQAHFDFYGFELFENFLYTSAGPFGPRL